MTELKLWVWVVVSILLFIAALVVNQSNLSFVSQPLSQASDIDKLIREDIGANDLSSNSLEKLTKWLTDKSRRHSNNQGSLVNLEVLLLMAVSMGIFGGVVGLAYEKANIDNLHSFIVKGLAASLLVPLFLHVIGSNIINQSESDVYQYLIFMGFCLIAAIYSTKFIDSVAEQTLKKAKTALDKAEENDATIQKLIKLREEDKSERDSYDRSQHLIAEAKLYGLEGDYKEAIIHLDRSLRTCETARAWGAKGNIFHELAIKEDKSDKVKREDHLKKAREAATKGLNAKYLTKDLEADLYFNRACYNALLEDGSFEEIVQDLEKSIAIIPIYTKEIEDESDFKGYSKYSELVKHFSKIGTEEILTCLNGKV